jgi:hypothetical protein
MIEYETQTYCEFKMLDAIKDYDSTLSVSALTIAIKHGVPVQDLHRAYAQYKAQK